MHVSGVMKLPRVAGRPQGMTIFGFNTDVKHGETVYHVQSEVRQRVRLLQTQVFVGGRCLGKRVFAFGEGFDEEQIQEALKVQHRLVLDAVKDGSVEQLFARAK